MADLYALNASTGATIWHTNLASAPAHFVYSSTAYYNGSVYVGISSLGDCPLSNALFIQVNATTGQVQHTYNTAPQGCVGASVWGSPTIDEASGKIYFVTGNKGKCSTTVPLAESIIELNTSDLSLVASWQVPAAQAPGDSDFGSTPTLFQATINGSSRSLVGVPNKNGVYYAFDRTNISAGPIWQTTLAVPGDSPENGKGSIAASAFDGNSLYVAGGNTTISGKSCAGSVQALNPATGAPLWQTCLSAPVLAPVMAVPGLVVVGSGQLTLAINAANGNIVFNYNDNVSNSFFWSGATVANGMLFQGTNGGTLYAFAAPSVPTPTPTQATPSPTGTPGNLQPGPVSKTWYFAEGRVGAGFTEYLSLENPTSTACAVSITYLYTQDRGTPQVKTIAVTVPANTRSEEGVDADLGTSPSGFGIIDSAIVAVNTTATPTCAGIVAERPMYFNALGTNSGSDVLGVTTLAKSFYIGDVGVNNGYSSFITILNPPGGQSATVTATYYAGGISVGSDTVQVPTGTRGTIATNSHTTPTALPAHVSVVVTSDQPVAVERPTYFSQINGGNAGTVSGGADVIAVQALSNDWLFAEGYTGGQFQENFIIANLDTTAKASATVTIKLEPQNGGAPSTSTVTVPTLSQLNWNVNALSQLPGQSLSAEISSTGAKIVVEREMFFHYLHNANGRSLATIGGSDVLGQVGPAAKSNYSFAEGYVNLGYDTWLTLQNPTTTPETIWITLYNAVGTTYTTSVSVPAQSRATQDITGMVIRNLYHAGDNFRGYEVSMVVQTTSTQGGPFVAERPMYITVGSNQAGTDIIGYTGG